MTPGENVYDLSVEVTGITPGEPVCVTIIAMDGETVLFESPPLTVATTVTQTATPPQPFSAPLTYTGPGADAVGVEILSTGAVLPPGGSRTFEAEVLGGDGSVLTDVPLGWTVASPAVASVTDAGAVTGRRRRPDAGDGDDAHGAERERVGLRVRRGDDVHPGRPW